MDRGIFSFPGCHSREDGNPESCKLAELDARLRGHDEKAIRPTAKIVEIFNQRKKNDFNS